MLSAASSRRARSLPPGTSDKLAGILSGYGSGARSSRLGPLRAALGVRSNSKENTTAARGRKTQRFPLGPSSRRANGLHRMEGKKRVPDYTDLAYREAVSRLRYLLAESYTSPHRASPFRSMYGGRGLEEGSGGEDVDPVIERTRALLSPFRRPYYPSARRSLYTRSPGRLSAPAVHVELPPSEPLPPVAPHTAPSTPRAAAAQASEQAPGGTLPPEMMAYIERQEEYIDQLEREATFCRDELSGLLGKVKEVIAENEGLQDKQKSGVLKSVLDYLQQHSENEEEEEEDEDTETSEVEPRRKKQRDRGKQPRTPRTMEGPSIVFESRISELEAQLTQVRIDLKKSQDEAELYKRRLAGEGLLGDAVDGDDPLRHQLDALKREKHELNETVNKLQTSMAQLRDRESDVSHRLKRSQEAVEHAIFERSQSELEVRRLKDELDRLHGKLREAVAEQGRRAAEERTGVERRYQQQVEQLQTDLAGQWDSTGRLQMELEKQRRTEAELRREIERKNTTIDDMTKETQAKIEVLQGRLSEALSQQGSLEQEVGTSRLLADRTEREARQESKRLGAEVAALRERLDRADSETLRARQEALRLSEQLAALDREMTLSKAKGDGATKAPPREQELMAMIANMQEKHVETVAELEGMIQSQNQVMDKLKDECHTLTQRLEDSSMRHKDEMVGLQNNIEYLTNKLEASLEAQVHRDLESSLYEPGDLPLETDDEPAEYHEPPASVTAAAAAAVSSSSGGSAGGGVAPSVARPSYQQPPEPGAYQPAPEGRGLYDPTQQGRLYSEQYKATDTRAYETDQRIGKYESSEGQSTPSDNSQVLRSSAADDTERTRSYDPPGLSDYSKPERSPSRDEFESSHISPTGYGEPDSGSRVLEDFSARRAEEDLADYKPTYQQPQRTPSREALLREQPQLESRTSPAKYVEETTYQQPSYEATEQRYDAPSSERRYERESPSKTSSYQPQQTPSYVQQQQQPQQAPSYVQPQQTPSYVQQQQQPQQPPSYTQQPQQAPSYVPQQQQSPSRGGGDYVTTPDKPQRPPSAGRGGSPGSPSVRGPQQRTLPGGQQPRGGEEARKQP